MWMSLISTNKPNEVTVVITPSKTSPTLSSMYSHLSQVMASRVASSARRSVLEQWSARTGISSRG